MLLKINNAGYQKSKVLLRKLSSATRDFVTLAKLQMASGLTNRVLIIRAGLRFRDFNTLLLKEGWEVVRAPHLC